MNDLREICLLNDEDIGGIKYYSYPAFKIKRRKTNSDLTDNTF